MEQLVPGLEEAQTAAEAYAAVIRAWNAGRLSPQDTRVGLDLVKTKATVLAAEEFRKRLEAAKRPAEVPRNSPAALKPAPSTDSLLPGSTAEPGRRS